MQAAIFAHDYNVEYIRELLRAHWITSTWPFDSATTGGHVEFELYQSATTEAGDTAAGGRGRVAGYTVVGRMVAASWAQQRLRAPLTPPHEPPGTSVFLRMKYVDFRRAVLAAVLTQCVHPSLRQAVRDIAADAAPHSASSAWEWPRGAGVIAVACALLLVACASGAVVARIWDRARCQRVSAMPASTGLAARLLGPGYEQQDAVASGDAACDAAPA